MKSLLQAFIAVLLCAPVPLAAADSQATQAKRDAADLFSCHSALLALYYYPYLREFGEGGETGSRIVKDRRTDELTDIILLPSKDPKGYWAYEKSGAHYFFPIPVRKGDDLTDHFYKLQLGKRFVFINEEMRLGMSQPLLQPTAFNLNGSSPYATIRPAKSIDDGQFQGVMTSDITENLLSKSCSHYREELNAAGGEPSPEITRSSSEHATRGTVAALGACETIVNESINKAAERELVSCELKAPGTAPLGGGGGEAREGDLRDGKVVDVDREPQHQGPKEHDSDGKARPIGH